MVLPMLVMAISICKILCVPLVTQTVSNGKDYFSTYLVYILAGLTVWLVDVCWSIFFLRKRSAVNNWFFSFVSWFIVCTFPQNISHIAMDCYQLQLGHELLVDQLNRHLLKPNTGCESQDHLGLENFSQVFEILKIATVNSPFPRPWAVETWTS